MKNYENAFWITPNGLINMLLLFNLNKFPFVFDLMNVTVHAKWISKNQKLIAKWGLFPDDKTECEYPRTIQTKEFDSNNSI